MEILFGGPALSTFRTDRLLKALAPVAGITGLQTRYVYLVHTTNGLVGFVVASDLRAAAVEAHSRLAPVAITSLKYAGKAL